MTLSSTGLAAILIVLTVAGLTLVTVLYLLVRDFLQRRTHKGDTKEREQG